MSLVKLADRHVGWQTGAGVVATARMERDGHDLVIAELEYDDVASLRDLLGAVLDVATVPLIRGDQSVLGECGFERREREWVRRVPTAPAPDERTRAITLEALEAAIRASWSAETSAEPDAWTWDNPSFQHCDVTSWVVKDYLGGEILAAGVVRDGVRVDRHAWNRLPSGLAIDLTREQFRDGEQLEEPGVAKQLIGATTEERYRIFAARVRAKLGS